MSAAATPTPTALTPGPLWVKDHSYGSLVSIITWFLIITSFLSVFARIGTRLAVVKKLYADDITILVALLLSIGQSICVSLQVTHGLGQPAESQTPENLERFQKEFFAGSQLYIAVLTLIKISVCLYLTGLTPVRLQKTIVLVTGSFILLWGVSSMFILGFQCSLPQTWNTIDGKCIDLRAFWTYVDIMNVITDMPLVILPAMIISKLHADTSRKAIVIGCFAARIMVIGGSAAQLFYLHHDFSHGSDFTLQVWRSVLCTEVVIFLSFFTACIPYLKPLVEAMESGMIRGDDLRRRGQDHEAWPNANGTGNGGSGNVSRWGRGMFSSGGGTSKNNTKAMSSKKAMRMDNLSSDSSRSMSMQTMGPHQGSKHLTNTTISGGHLGHKSKSGRVTEVGIDDDGDSQSSQSKIIKKTMTFNISEEPQTRMPDYLNGGYAR